MNYTWIIDNGHGGLIDGQYQTAGKRGPLLPDGRQILEGVANRKIVAELARILTFRRVHHHVLVPEQLDISLKVRCRRVNNLHHETRNCILISIHCNAGGGTGWECWTSVGKTKADTVATYFYQSYAREFPSIPVRTDFSDGDPGKEADFYILKHTACPAILTENFFMDRQVPDGEILLSESGIVKIASFHADAILRIERERPV